MVSGGTVRSDCSSISSTLKSYQSEVSSLASSWKGQSFDNLESKASEFVGEFDGAISGQMNAFASACESYERYKEAKANYKTAKSNYESAKAAKDSSAISRYQNDMNTYKGQMEKLKAEIEANLQTASSVKLEATSSTGKGGSGAKVDYTDDANFTFFDQYNGGWGDNGSYYKSDGSWDDFRYSACGPTSLAMVLNALGEDVNPTTVANWCTENGFHWCGTTQGFVESYAKQDKNITSQTVGTDRSAWIDSLNSGDLLVINARGGTTLGMDCGHYLAVRGYDESSDSVLIADPNCGFQSGWQDIDSVIGQLNGEGAWAVGRE